jgi:hypothetical protein
MRATFLRTEDTGWRIKARRAARGFVWVLAIALVSHGVLWGATPVRLTFPDCGKAPGITPNANGDKLFVHVVDSLGYDFEVWCRSGVISFYYEFWASFPDGTRTKVDECELEGGKNDVVLHITGSTNTTTAANGGQRIDVTGQIWKYYHHNLNSSRDFHTIFNFTNKVAIRIDTKREQQPGGGYWDRYDKILNVESRTLVSRAISRDSPEPEARYASGGKGTAPLVGCECSAGAIDEALTIGETALLRRRKKPASVYYPHAQRMDAIRFDEKRKRLHVELPGNAPMPNFSLSFPRDLLGNKEHLSEVRVDGKTVQVSESISATFRTVNVPLNASARQIMIRMR